MVDVRRDLPGSRRKDATRAKLSELALGAFASRGFEQTTVAEIAAQAGVTERTFFNHFKTKLDAIFPRAEYESFGSLQRLIEDQPTSVDDIDAACTCGLRWMVEEIGSDAVRHHQTSRLRVQISETSPVVRGMRAAVQQQMATAMISGLAHRHGRAVPTASEDAIGTAISAVVHQAFIRWLESDDPYSYEKIAYERLSVFVAVIPGHT